METNFDEANGSEETSVEEMAEEVVKESLDEEVET